MRKLAGSLLLVLVVALGGCGGGDEETEKVKTKRRVLDVASAESEIKQGVAEKSGRDVSAVECPEDVKPEAGGTFTCTVRLAGKPPASGSVVVTQEDAQGTIDYEIEGEKAGTADCQLVGVSFDGGKEGTCVEGTGEKVTIVNKDHPLKLKELDAHLEAIERLDTIASSFSSPEVAQGVFLIFRLRIKNKLDVPASFDEFQSQVSLSIDGKTFDQDFDAENQVLEDSFLSIGEAIQPEGEQTGAVAFDVPDSVAVNLDKRSSGSNLFIVNFSDADGENASAYGVIRLYK